MAWFKIDDGFHTHPKALAAGNAACGLWTRLGSYTSSQLLDGFVPAAIARSYGTRAELTKLCTATLLEHRPHDAYGDGYWLHDYLDYNPSAEHVRAERAKATERQRAARERRDQAESQDKSQRVSRRTSRRDNERDFGVSHAAPTRPDPTRPVSTTARARNATSRSTDTSPARTVTNGRRSTRSEPSNIAEILPGVIGKGGR